MQTQKLPNKNSNLPLLFLVLTLLVVFFYVPNVFAQLQSAEELEKTTKETLAQKKNELETLEKEFKDFGALKKEEQEKIINRIPATFRQESFMEFIENVRKATSVEIGNISFSQAKQGSGLMKTRDISMTIRAVDKNIIKNFLEKFEQAEQFYTIKNFTIQTSNSFTQADIIITAYFGQ